MAQEELAGLLQMGRSNLAHSPLLMLVEGGLQDMKAELAGWVERARLIVFILSLCCSSLSESSKEVGSQESRDLAHLFFILPLCSLSKPSKLAS